MECSFVPAYPHRDFDFDEDRNYEIWRTGEAAYQFSGDTLNLDQEDFGSLVRKIVDRIPNIRELVFDARNIRLLSPLSFTGAKLIFLAEQFSIGRSGQISFVQDPSVHGSGVKIVAREITIADDALPVPFMFRLGQAPADIRHFEITALSLISQGQPLRDEEAMAKELFSRTLGAAFGAAITSIRVIAGASAEAAWKDSFRREMDWPIHFAAKIGRLHARAPHYIEHRNGLLEIIQQYLPLVAEWEDAGPILAIGRTADLIHRNLDPLEKPEGFVPRLRFEEYAKRLNQIAEEMEDNGYLGILNSLVLDRNGSADRRRLLGESLRSQRADISAEVQGTLKDLDDCAIEYSTIQQQLESSSDSIEQLRLRLKDRLERLRSQNERDWEFGRNINFIALAASLIPVTRPAALALSTAIQVVGDVSTGGAQPGRDLITVRLPELYQRSKTFYEQAAKMRKAWGETTQAYARLKRNLDGRELEIPPGEDGTGKSKPTRAERAFEFGAAAQTFTAEFDALRNLAEPPRPQQLELNNLEKDDVDLQSALTRQQALTEKEAASRALIGKLLTKIATHGKREAEIASQLDEVLAASLTNDRDRSRWHVAALRLRRQFLDETYATVACLRQSVPYWSGEPLNTLDDIFYYPDERRSRLVAGQFPSEENDKFETHGEWLREVLSEERRLLKASITANLRLAHNSRAQHFETRGGSRRNRYPFPIYLSSRSDGSAQSVFIASLNAELERQMRARAAGHEYPDFSALPRQVLPIEFPGLVGRPEFLVDMRVNDIDLVDRGSADDISLQFTIIHPGFGVLHHRGGCLMYDFRAVDRDAEIRRTTVVHVRSQDAPTIRLEPSQDDEIYERYPFRTTYYFVADLWAPRAVEMKAPTIREMTIELVIEE